MDGPVDLKGGCRSRGRGPTPKLQPTRQEDMTSQIENRDLNETLMVIVAAIFSARGGRAHASQIVSTAKREYGTALSVSMVFKSLNKLLAWGLIEADLEDESALRGNRGRPRRRLFRITDQGAMLYRKKLRSERERLEVLAGAIPKRVPAPCSNG